MKIARVIVTDTPVPGKNTASWPKLITRLLQDGLCVIDALISPPSTTKLQTGHRIYYCNQKPNKLLNKLRIVNRYRHYFKAVKELLREYDCLILCVIDSTRVKNELADFLVKNNLQHRVRIIFYFHGYAYFFPKTVWEHFVQGIHHFIFLTRVAYEYHLAHSVTLPFAVSVVNNPIDQRLFKPATSEEKKQLRKQFNWSENNKHFVWLSHNRPKKGFDVVLTAWTLWMQSGVSNVQLHVIGVEGATQMSNVEFLGIVDNDAVADYLRASDIGLFSTLVQEGFGLSLLEMMSCGCFTIASQFGGVREFFNQEKHGIAIQYPNEVSEWINAFSASLRLLPSWQMQSHQHVFLDYHEWALQIEQIFKQEEIALQIAHNAITH